MAKILLIETATEVCSVAIAVDGVVVARHEEASTLHHAALLTQQVADCAAAAGWPLSALDAVAVSAGPGSYTSLRVGASVAKGLCYALDKPLLAVDTLLALAAASLLEMGDWQLRDATAPAPDISLLSTPNVLIPMLEARRQEVWAAAYDRDLQLLLPAQPLILENDLLDNFLRQASPGEDVVKPFFSGNGSLKLQAVLAPAAATFSTVRSCSATQLAALAEQAFQRGDFQSTAYFEVTYMKPPNITTSTKSLF